MIHLIRHSEKQWDNGRKPKNSLGQSHDPPLEFEKGTLSASQLSEQLLMQEDQPSFIFCSPFLRCRQTAEAMVGDLNVPIIVCPLLREYLGNWKGREIEIEEDTEICLDADDKLIESWQEFSRRSQSCAEWLMLMFDNVRERGSLWIVTHGTLMRQLNNFLSRENYPIALHWQD